MQEDHTAASPGDWTSDLHLLIKGGVRNPQVRLCWPLRMSQTEGGVGWWKGPYLSHQALTQHATCPPQPWGGVGGLEEVPPGFPICLCLVMNWAWLLPCRLQCALCFPSSTQQKTGPSSPEEDTRWHQPPQNPEVNMAVWQCPLLARGGMTMAVWRVVGRTDKTPPSHRHPHLLTQTLFLGSESKEDNALRVPRPTGERPHMC